MGVLFYVLGSIIVIATLIAGAVLKLFPPKNIGARYGLRIKAAMKSQEAWDYAHKLCAKLLLIYSIFSIILFVLLSVVISIVWSQGIFLILILGVVLAIGGVVLAYFVVKGKTNRFNQQN